MRDDYLWDGSGEPDPEIKKLETVLGRLRHTGAAPEFPEMAPAKPVRRRFWQMRAFQFAAVAAGVLVVGTLTLMLRQSKPPVSSRPGWDVTRVAGAPRVGAENLSAQRETGKLRIGQMLETDGQSQANIRVEEVGEINVEPNTVLRLPDSGSGLKRLALDRGTIHASIWAPAGEFVIDTPSAVAVDLGCTYTLHVDDSGNGLLQTTFGWVGFKLGDREAFIPAGAACSTKKKTGPGIPYFEDASEDLRSAVSKLDLESSTSEERGTALQVILTRSRKHDALTLWHLLSRAPEAERGRVYDRLAHFVPPPAGVTREGILHLDRNMLDLWWNQLGFGDVGLWRHWERAWSDRSSNQ